MVIRWWRQCVLTHQEDQRVCCWGMSPDLNLNMEKSSSESMQPLWTGLTHCRYTPIDHMNIHLWLYDQQQSLCHFFHLLLDSHRITLSLYSVTYGKLLDSHRCTLCLCLYSVTYSKLLDSHRGECSEGLIANWTLEWIANIMLTLVMLRY